MVAVPLSPLLRMNVAEETAAVSILSAVIMVPE